MIGTWARHYTLIYSNISELLKYFLKMVLLLNTNDTVTGLSLALMIVMWAAELPDLDDLNVNYW